MTFLAYTDGASRGNPGDSGIGIFVKDEHGNRLLSVSGFIGQATNNLAEYTALLALVKRVKKLGCSHLVVHSDSELMVRQMTGEYRVRDQQIGKLWQKIRNILDKGLFKFEIRHIPREMNGEADRLANMGIDSRKKIRI